MILFLTISGVVFWIMVFITGFFMWLTKDSFSKPIMNCAELQDFYDKVS